MFDTESTVFEKIARREIPATIVFENDRVIAFDDIEPKALVHVLVVPKTSRYRNVTELAAGDPGLLAEIVQVASDIARDKADGAFRLIFNTGEKAGQTVFHMHAHVLAGDLDEASIG